MPESNYSSPNKTNFRPPALGGVSLLVIFAVLCLTVFALLSLSTVQADCRLADATAQSVSDYYAADLEAQTILAKLRQGERPANVAVEAAEAASSENNTIAPEAENADSAVNSNSPSALYSYTCQISETQNLQVQVRLNPQTGAYSVLRWQAVPSGNWQTEDTLELWDGTTF